SMPSSTSRLPLRGGMSCLSRCRVRERSWLTGRWARLSRRHCQPETHERSFYRQNGQYMCGINGIFACHYAANPLEREELLRTRDYMAMREPDGRGEWLSADGRVGFGH